MFDKARCDQCPLYRFWGRKGQWEPTDFEKNNSDILILGDAPSKQDSKLRRVFSDRHGALIVDALSGLGLSRQDVDWGNVIGCRWPKDDPKSFLALLQKRNRKLVAKGHSPIPTPIEACRGHFAHNIAEYKTVIPLGSYATKAILEGNPSLEDVRGGPTIAKRKNILPTYHPKNLTNRLHLWSVFEHDLAKGLRHHKDALQWDDPLVYYNPDPGFVQTFFERIKKKGEPLAYDVETDGINSLTAGLRCIGIGTTKEVVVIGFDSITGESNAFYTKEQQSVLVDLLRHTLTDAEVLKIGHNAGYFDRTVVEQHLGITPTPLIDTLLLHKLAASEHPHRLGFVASLLLDVPAWKADHTGVTARTDKELHSYCATDVAVTARIASPLRTSAAKRKQLHLYPMDADIQDLCAGMHRLGIRVDEGRRFEHEQEQTKIAAKWLGLIHSARPGLNPNSNTQLRDVLFDEWALPPQDYTMTGEPSTNATTLRALVVNPLVDDEQKMFINAVRFYRRAEKLLSTYLRNWAPNAGMVREGYIHPDYLAHGTVTGRLSSSKPNFQNIPYTLRNIFIPPEGCVFVGADYDQLELRFAAALAGATHYLDAFEKQEIDPHNLTADLMFGKDFWDSEGAPRTKLGKGTGQFKQLRNLAKTICFASLYGAAPPKVHEIISRAEDDDGNMLYAHYNLRQIRTLHRRWLQRAPEFKAWWEKSVRGWRRTNYVEEVVMKRRRYFAQEDYNAILNFGVQAGGFAIVAKAMLTIVNEYLPFDFGQRTGLVNQLHDAVLFAVPDKEADNARIILNEVLVSRVPELPITFTAKAIIGNNWREV
jgi:DNA polymerase-1